MLYVRLTVYYTVSFTCTIHFLSSTYLFSIILKVTSLSVSFAAGYIFAGSNVCGLENLSDDSGIYKFTYLHVFPIKPFIRSFFCGLFL